MKPYVYVIIRNDISVEQKVVQASHAALESGFKFNTPIETASIIVLQVSNEQELLNVSARLDNHKIEHVNFYEPDFGPLGFTAICTRPLFTSKERHLFKRYNLYKKDEHKSIELHTQ